MEKIPLLALAAVSCKIAVSVPFPVDAATLPVDSVVAGGTAVECPGFVRRLSRPVFLSRRYGCLLSSSAASRADRLGCRSTGSAGRRSPQSPRTGWRRRPYVLVGWLWFLGMLVPVLGLVQLGYHARADRYTYLSQIGLSIALAWSVWMRLSVAAISIGKCAGRDGCSRLCRARQCSCLLRVAWRQTSYWRNSETLFTHAARLHRAKCDGCILTLPFVCTEQGRVTEAITHLREALAAGSVKLDDDRQEPLSSWRLFEFARENRRGALGVRTSSACLLPSGKMCIFAWRVLLLPPAGTIEPSSSGARSFGWPPPIGRRVSAWPMHCWLAEILNEAATECREVMKQEPSAVEAIAILGAALVAEGQAEEALATVEARRGDRSAQCPRPTSNWA